MIVAMISAVVLVVVTIVVLYETLRLTSDHLCDLPLPPHARIIVVVLATFAGHTLADGSMLSHIGFSQSNGSSAGS